MKKLLFLFMIFSLNANAANFTDTLGAECGRILFYLEERVYPDRYDQFKSRNSQFFALKKCLDIYKENGGDIDELNKRYELAKMIYNSNLAQYRMLEDSKEFDQHYEAAKIQFFSTLKRKREDIGFFTVDKYEDGKIIFTFLKDLLDSDLYSEFELKKEEPKKPWYKRLFNKKNER